ncbi:MAG: hypothetical protein CL920_12650 [Deltaproteobacteria bacterium]|nr:hypothetical protein [Deltaproteobacteria bacterium]
MKRIHTSLMAGLFSALLVAGCASTPKEFVIKKSPTSPSSKDFPKADLVTLLRKVNVVISNDGYSFKEDTHIQYKALTARGAKRLRRIGVRYSNNRQLKDIQARLVRPNGWISRGQMFTDVPNLYGRQYFSASRWRGTGFSAVVPGSVLEYRYTRTGKSWFIPSHYIQRTMPVIKTVYSISVPDGVGFRHKVYSGPSFAASKVKHSKNASSGRTIHTWTAENVPAVEIEPGMPAWINSVARLSVISQRLAMGEYKGSGRDWNSIANFYKILVGKRNQPTPFITTFTKKLIKGASSNDDKIRKIYDFVRKEIRYVFVGFGLGGWQPQAAEFTLKQRYGDCKAKATLLQAMLRAVGIRSHQVLVRTRHAGKLDRTFPVDSFNHVINYIPSLNKGTFVDATTSDNRLEVLRHDDQGASALIVSPKKSRFTTIPAFTPDHNLKHTKITVVRGKENVTGTIKLRLGGNFRVRVDGLLEQGRLKKPKARNMWAARTLGRLKLKALLKGFKVTSVDFSGQNEKYLSTMIKFKAASLQGTLRKGKTIFFNAGKFLQSSPSSKYLKKRKQNPIVWNQKDSHVKEIDFKGWYFVDGPKSFKTSNKHVNYSLKAMHKGNHVELGSKLKYNSDYIGLKDHEVFRKTFEDIHKHEYKLLVLSTVPPGGNFKKIPPSKPKNISVTYPKKWRGVSLGIDAMRGGEDKGVVGWTYVSSSKVNLQLANKVASHLKAQGKRGYKVAMSRKDDTDVASKKRVSTLRRSKLLLQIDMGNGLQEWKKNKAYVTQDGKKRWFNDGVAGFQIVWSKDNKKSKQTKKWATCLGKSLKRAGYVVRKARKGESMTSSSLGIRPATDEDPVLSGKTPAVRVVAGYLTHRKEAKAFASSQHIFFAKAIEAALVCYQSK